MTKLAHRSDQEELLDRDDIPFADIKQNMQELDSINNWLGGHRVTIAGFKNLLSGSKLPEPITVCEIGCGGGNNLAALHAYCRRKNIPVRFIGIDIKPECIRFAGEQYPDLPATWISSDYRQVEFGGQQPDIIFSSLFCHHFSETALVDMMQWMSSNARTGSFINDLHRHPLAYHSIALITRLFSRSYLVKHDAPLSVARGFTKNEWDSIFRLAGISNYRLRWMWAFRYLITCRHDAKTNI